MKTTLISRTGMTTVEHCLPIPTLYNDVLYLYARSGTGATPTHIVNYGGAWGEQLVWAFMDVPNDPKYMSRVTIHVYCKLLTSYIYVGYGASPVTISSKPCRRLLFVRQIVCLALKFTLPSCLYC